MLLGVLMASETIYAVAGAIVRRIVPPERVHVRSAAAWASLAIAALIATLAYDATTNLYTGLVWARLAPSQPASHWIAVALFNPGALWFAFAHLSSNVIFFTLFAPPLLRLARWANRRAGW
jgi:hypothetical protein